MAHAPSHPEIHPIGPDFARSRGWSRSAPHQGRRSPTLKEIASNGRMLTGSSFALAHRLGAAVVTADLRFANALALAEHGEAVVTTRRALRRCDSVASQTTARRSGGQAATR